MVEQSQTTIEQNPLELSLAKVVLRAVLWTGFFLLIFLLITALIALFIGYQKFSIFAAAAGQSPSQVLSVWQKAYQDAPCADVPGTVLILGSDHVANRGNDPILTDTMMLLRLDSTNASIRLYSLPRDLWLPTYQTKINALYYYGQKRSPNNPTGLVQEALATDLGIQVDQTLVISLDQIGALVDDIGGLPIDIPTGFVDPEFPRTDVDIRTERDPAKLYQRVAFQPGQQTLTGEQTLQYIRSRHAEGDQGTDIARAQRQQLVISSLLKVLKNPRFYTADLARAGRLYKFYLETFSALFPPPVLLSEAKQLWPKRNELRVQSSSPSIFPEQPTGVITHPPLDKKYQNQWVYIIRDTLLFKQEVETALSN